MLIENWRAVFRYAWSVRLIVLAAILTGVEFVFAVFVNNPPVAPGLFAAFGFLVTIAAFLVRFIAQRKVSGNGDQ